MVDLVIPEPSRTGLTPVFAVTGVIPRGFNGASSGEMEFLQAFVGVLNSGDVGDASGDGGLCIPMVFTVDVSVARVLSKSSMNLSNFCVLSIALVSRWLVAASKS